MSDVRIVLHTCCGPCATACIERLEASGQRAVLFFSNSNIFPGAEYLKRLENAKKLARLLSMRIEEDVYDHDAWLAHVRGFEDEPEGGLRCLRCFGFNLARTARFTDDLDFPAFTTSLSVSRHKSSQKIFEAGKPFPKFEPIDFKKGNGYARSIELSRLYGLYRQGYCGCEFGRRSGE